MPPMRRTDYTKELVAGKSLDFIEDGMVVGLGTGSTATCFIKLLGERMKRGLKIRSIPSSRTSKELAESLSIPVIDFQQCPEIDVEIDGADEIAPGLALIKGGGGALLLEKIVASAARRFIVIADSSKVVTPARKRFHCQLK
jgi:ribose 5-phosphate isomerase A